MIEVRNLSYSIPDLPKSILESVNFTLNPGELVSVLGANGAGKTTLLRCLFALLDFQGSCLLDGKDLQVWSRKELAQKISYVPQLGARLPDMLVREFVFLARKPRFSSLFETYSGHSEIVEKSLAETGGLEFIGRSLNSLSGGEVQRVLLAAALAQETPVILMDEPTTFLDLEHETGIYRVLESLRRDHQKAILIVSHNCNRSALVSSKILALLGGKQVFLGDPEDFMDQSVLDLVFGPGSLLVSHPSASCEMLLPRVLSE